MEENFNYIGYLVGCDSRTPENYKRLLLLRETEKYYIEPNGKKYRKKDGYEAPEKELPMYCLNLESIRKIDGTKMKVRYIPEDAWKSFQRGYTYDAIRIDKTMIFVFTDKSKSIYGHWIHENLYRFEILAEE